VVCYAGNLARHTTSPPGAVAMMLRTLTVASLSTLLTVAAMPAAAGEPRVITDYEDSRLVFRGLAKEVVANPDYGSPDNRPILETLKVEYPGKPDEDLTLDALTIPARKQKTLVIQINSGIHGLEAPTGSYMQQHFLTKCLPTIPEEMLDQTTFVVTHALDPWGFKHASRFNANNVDLNRNCGGAQPNGKFNICDGGARNERYGKVQLLFHGLVQSPLPINPDVCKGIVFATGAVAAVFEPGPGNIEERGNQFFERALRGQTEDPKGIYFAGKELQPECKLYQDFSKRFYEGEDAHQHSLTITWHTGYGELGHLQYMGDPSDLDSSRLVSVLKQQITNDEITKLDFCPTFETCNDENVWLRNVEPARKPDGAGKTLNGYLTAEIGGLGGVESICAVLMSEQLTGERAKPLFKPGSQDERKFRDQIFNVFNPMSNADYRKRIEDHAKNSCTAIKGYIQTVLTPQLGGPMIAPNKCPKR
jgi:Protein of unknown function (DUF2817)